LRDVNGNGANGGETEGDADPEGPDAENKGDETAKGEDDGTPENTGDTGEGEKA
jgi:hypothetical protein